MKEFLKFENTFPCAHCGECPNWLAYTSEDINDNTLIENCIQSKCSIFGTEVQYLNGPEFNY